jgi:hypothetical protein
LEVAPATAGVAEGIGAGTVITAAAGNILPPDNVTSLSFARKADGKDPTSKIGKAGGQSGFSQTCFSGKSEAIKERIRGYQSVA